MHPTLRFRRLSASLVLLLLLQIVGGEDPAGKCHAVKGVINVMTVSGPAGTEDYAQTLVDVEKAIVEVHLECESGCVDLIMLPELFSFNADAAPSDGFDTNPQAGAEAVGGPSSQACGRWAVRYRAYVLCPIAELDADGEGKLVVYNTALLMDRGGEVVGKYRKRFLTYGGSVENDFSLPDEALPVFRTDFGVVGVLTCFDVHFTALWQELNDLKVDLVLWPSAFDGRQLVRAHSITHHYPIVLNGLGVFFEAGGQEVFTPCEGVRGAYEVAVARMDTDQQIVYRNDPRNRGRALTDEVLEKHRDCLQGELIDDVMIAIRSVCHNVSASSTLAAHGVRGMRAYRAEAKRYSEAWRAARKPIPSTLEGLE